MNTLHDHLTDEQMDQLAFSQQSSARANTTFTVAAIQHLTECPRCRQELDRLTTTFGNLRQATTLWAASQTPTFDASLIQSKSAPLPFRRPLHFAWAGGVGTLALAAGLTLSVLHIPSFHLPGLSRTGPVVATNQPAQHANVQPGPSDEALLEGVENDLADSVPPTLAPLSVSTTR